MDPERGRQFGMPVQDFVDETYKGLVSGKDQVIVQSVGPAETFNEIVPVETFNEIVNKRRSTFQNLSKWMRGEK